MDQNTGKVDLERFNPNWAFAVMHGKACRPGIARNQEKQNDLTKLCECCLNVIDKKPVPLCQNSKELEFMGFGFPIYFLFLKMVIFLLLVLIASYTAIGIYWAIESNYEFCALHIPRVIEEKEIQCTSWMIRFARIELEVETSEIVLRFSSFVIQMIVLIYIRDQITKTASYHEERQTSLSDFAVFIENLPEQVGCQAKLRSFFHDIFQQSAEEIILMNDLDEYFELREEKAKAIEKRRKYMKAKDSKQIEKIDRQIDHIKQKMKQIYKIQNIKVESDECLSDKAIVIFSTQQDKNKILEIFKNCNPQQFKNYFDGKAELIQISQASQPKQIIWENINVPHQKKFFRIILGWCCWALTIAIVTVIFFFILEAKTHAIELAKEQAHIDPEKSSDAHRDATIAVYISLTLVILFNKLILAKLLHLFVDWEMHNTAADFELSFALKYATGLLFTTALMTLLVQDIRFKNIYTEEYGVLQEETIFFFFAAFLVNFIWLLNPWDLMIRLKRKMNFGRIDVTQREANQMMENCKYSIGKRYAEIIQSIWFTFFYASVLPFGSILMLIAFSLFYWIDKYNLLRKSSTDVNVSAELGFKMMKLLDFTLLVKPTGEIIFDSQIRSGVTYESIVCACIAAVFVVSPINLILNFIHPEKFQISQSTYQDVKNDIIENYVTLHPLYAKQRKEIIASMKELSGRSLQFEESHKNLSVESY